MNDNRLLVPKLLRATGFRTIMINYCDSDDDNDDDNENDDDCDNGDDDDDDVHNDCDDDDGDFFTTNYAITMCSLP